MTFLSNKFISLIILLLKKFFLNSNPARAYKSLMSSVEDKLKKCQLSNLLSNKCKGERKIITKQTCCSNQPYA